MKICGIVAEYNPFHNGHIYHIQKTREKTQCDLLIAVMSGNFTQRGEVAVTDKWKRCEAALNNGVDLVLELPFIYTVQCASVFANHAVETLKNAGINILSFGSETGNLEELKEIASLPVNVEHLKELMHQGESYPKAYGLLNDSIYPNDCLAVNYLRALAGSQIEPCIIQRTNDYNGLTLEPISSASAVRKAVKSGLNYQIATPMQIDTPLDNRDFYAYLRLFLAMSDRRDLQDTFLINEGIEKLFIEKSQMHSEYEVFLKACISKRYTKARIQRSLLQILLQNKKEDIQSLEPPHYLRVLGFNSKGREYLSSIKDNIKLVTRFKELPPTQKRIEEKAALLYTSILPETQKEEAMKREMMGPVILK